jgi:Na+/H+ antiporter NhaB
MSVGPCVTGWCLILEFIFTLAMALKSYPLQPGRLLALEAVPYTVTMILTGLLTVYVLLQPVTQSFYAQRLLMHHSPIVTEQAHTIPVSLVGTALTQ